MSDPADLRAKISQLSAAIDQHKRSNIYVASRGRGRGYSTWTPRGRGRGRGGPASMGSTTFGNKTLVLNQPTPATTSTSTKPQIATLGSTSTTPTAVQSPPGSKPAARPNRTVMINGVTFVADASGKKLTRKDVIPTATPSSLVAKMQAATTVPSSTYTPQKAQVEGVEYVRTKGGNLIRAELAKERQLQKAKALKAKSEEKLKRKQVAAAARAERKKKRTSRSKGGHLVYVKEPEGYVRQGRHGKSLVLQGNQIDKSKVYCGYYTRYEIMPHCSHFQRGKCERVNCPYPHVRVSPQASVCKAFALEGYCSKGVDCKNKHIHVCPDFAETGKCENATCKLPHVALKNKRGQQSKPKIKQWVNPQLVGQKREREQTLNEPSFKKVKSDEAPATATSDENHEEDGFVKFDDGDEGWGAFQMKDEDDAFDENQSLHFSDHESESGESDEESDSDADEEDVSSSSEDEGDHDADVLAIPQTMD
ncbi:hypothetical protein NQZ79_g7225 [Umbelopsis isabellina]|nr:hypothetical protein NQZ79_g7225 [Umbelopsis isabellina]